MLIKNKDIYNYVLKFNNAFDGETKYYPAKLNFIIQKNMIKLKDLSEAIEKARDDTIKHYGVKQNNVDGSYIVPKDKIEMANKELDELLNIEQEVDIIKIKISEIENIEFTSAQMRAIMFMIEE